MFATPPCGVKVIRARTITLPFLFRRLLAALLSASGTVIVGGLPEALDGLSRSLRFLAAKALATTALAPASVTPTMPAVETLTNNRLPWSRKVKALEGGGPGGRCPVCLAELLHPVVGLVGDIDVARGVGGDADGE